MEMNPTLIALAETVLYSECDDHGVPLDANYFVKDLAEESLKKLYGEYQQFISVVEKKITEKIGEKWDCIDDFYDLAQPALNQTECDYILTRNRHGAGFWDGNWCESVSEILTDAAQAQSEFDVYVSDDQKIYFL